ncbi:NAD(P)/FAD-dependent oxidoreductase [Frateuria hangzhouensis]|uniref:NAD(P)/FAD-dependent oxidoreductase n=1 Tax=Frateuria hangzhouensis TaxID=2995589 RepID=UPI002261016C|nr:tryptophan 7-halogenase [Frateuria sp. STR12]MCX7512589.1 tryptophan 7-halogenase [Frateuria sp. STR12]
MSEASATHDAVILGGGLAGLCLALQLRGEFPDLDVVVLERQRHPLPPAAHKVGESTVDIGAHYFRDTLGLRDYLKREQIFKFGLRYFFSDGCADLGQATELGLSEAFPAPSYQLDRGLFETFLGEEALRRGVDFRPGSVVRQFEVGVDGAPHSVRYADADAREHHLQARWLLDASGRAALLRRRFELTRDDGHHVNAAWFRLGARLAIDDWCEGTAWRARCRPPERWRSTNHLCGPGYWVWLIPLASGAHSVGIVADAAMHPLEEYRDFDRALAWLARQQPQVAQEVERHRDTLLDFRFLRGYSHGCRQMFSADRWALTGEAGAFLDPFYSPGSDFIALANTYICELIRADRASQPLAARVRLSERLYQSFYDSMLAIFRGQYPLFGNPQVMASKIVWDQAFYWGVLCQLVFQRRLVDTALFAELGPALAEAQRLNERVQALFRDWHAAATSERPSVMLDQRRLDWFRALNEGMHDSLDDAGVRVRLKANLALLHEVAGAIAALAGRDGAPVDGLPVCSGPAPGLFDLAPVEGAVSAA